MYYTVLYHPEVNNVILIQCAMKTFNYGHVTQLLDVKSAFAPLADQGHLQTSSVTVWKNKSEEEIIKRSRINFL